jgi:hypothetical protein
MLETARNDGDADFPQECSSIGRAPVSKFWKGRPGQYQNCRVRPIKLAQVRLAVPFSFASFSSVPKSWVVKRVVT